MPPAPLEAALLGSSAVRSGPESGSAPAPARINNSCNHAGPCREGVRRKTLDKNNLYTSRKSMRPEANEDFPTSHEKAAFGSPRDYQH